MNHRHRSDHALTLIELIMAITLIVIIGTMIYTVIATEVTLWDSSVKITTLNRNARIALGRLTQEMSEASAITIPSPNYVEYVHKGKNIRVYAHDYNDGTSPGAGPYKLRRAEYTGSFSWGDGRILAENITASGPACGLELAYFNQRGAPESTSSNIRLARITLTFNTGAPSTPTSSFSTSVHIKGSNVYTIAR